MKPEGLRRSQAQEKRLAQRHGGTVNSGSGNGLYRKGDVRTTQYLIEAKCRAKPGAKQITVKLDALKEVQFHAAGEGRIAVLSFELGGQDWYILNQADIDLEGGD